MSEATNETRAAEAAEIKMPYEFRKLGSDDIFLMFKIISKIGINEFKACFNNESIQKTIKACFNNESIQKTIKDGKVDEGSFGVVGVAVALDAANIILGNLHRCREEIYQMLANTSNLTIDEIRAEGNAIMFVEMVIDFVKKEEFSDFFKVVSKLFN